MRRINEAVKTGTATMITEKETEKEILSYVVTYVSWNPDSGV
jgi:hypothetical protein